MGDQKTVTKYNTWNQPIKIIDALGNKTRISYNTQFINHHGQRVLQKTTTDPLGKRTIETYDAANRLVESACFGLIGEKIAHQLLSYDLVGNQTGVEEEVIEHGSTNRVIKTLFSYNAANQITQIKQAAGSPQQKITSISYNQYGQKKKLFKPDGKIIHYTYDGFGRLKTCTSSDQTIDYVYEYNLLDQVMCVLDRVSGKATNRQYENGLLVKESLANGLSLSYTYDRTERARTITFPNGTGVEYLYNPVDLKEIHRLFDGKRTYAHTDVEHSLSGQIKKAQPPGNCGAVAYQFDPLDRCVSIKSSAFSQKIPVDGFDAAGNLLKFDMQKISYAFTYDDHYQLKSEKGHTCHVYSFDSLSNRTSKDEVANQYNSLNQLVKTGKETLHYDSKGNLTNNGPYEYSYDALDRLTQVRRNGSVTTYSYDSFNRRLSKTVDGEEELFLYQGQDEIGCWKGGVCKEIRLLGKNRRSRTAVIELNNTPYVPLHDMIGNIVCLLDFDGNIAEQYRFSAYGEREILSPSSNKLNRSAIGNPWQYSGKRFDEESGLIAFGMRYYDPSIGRWTTPDPAGYIDGSNVYAYVHNSPLQYCDQFGLFTDWSSGMGLAYKAFEYNSYSKFCTPLESSRFCQNPSSNISHFSMEDKLQERYNFGRSETESEFRAATFSVNDFVNPNTGKNYNFKEMPPNKKILYPNGVWNQFKDFKESLIHMATITEYNVQGVFCPTSGAVTDLYCYMHSVSEGAAYEGTREIQRNIREFYENSAPGFTMLIIPHSRGASYTLNALKDSPQEWRDCVDVRAFAPGAYIDPYLCRSIRHYESKNDIIPWLDYRGRLRCRDTITTLELHREAFGLDHTFTSPTYIRSIKLEIEAYLDR